MTFPPAPKAHLAKLLVVLLGLSLVGSACGQSRTAPDEVLAEESVQDTTVSSPDDTSADGAEDAATTPTTAPLAEPTPPPSTAPATEVAYSVDFGDGTTFELTHGDLNAVVIPTWENQDFVDRAFGGAVPPGFYAGVATEFLVGEIFDRQLSDLGGAVEATDGDQARDSLMGIMQSWFADDADPAAAAEQLYDSVPYLPFVVDLQSKQAAISRVLPESGALTAEVPCVRHILVDEEATALEVLDLLGGGGDFAALAAEYSTGPTGPNGGDLGCSPSDGYVPEFAAAVDAATLGEFVGPVQTQFGWHVLVVDRYEESTLDPAQVLNGRITEALTNLSIDVDPRIGVWDSTTLSIAPPVSE